MTRLSPMIGQQFAYAFGRTGVLKQLLLTQSDMDRLLGAKDKRDAEKILTELPLTSQIDQGISNAEEILHALRTWIRREVEEMAPPAKQPVFGILWSNGDQALLSYLLKKHGGFTSAVSNKPETSLTTYDPKYIEALFENGALPPLPEHMVTFIREWKERAASATPREIDAALAQYFADLHLRLARMSGSKPITQYVRHGIDLQNIRTALRAYDDETRASALLTGGSIAPKNLRGNEKNVLDTVSRSPLSYALSEAIMAAGEDPMLLERACANVLATDITDMWNVPMSIEPLFAFTATALSDVALLRSIMIGKNNGLAPQEIKKVLPPFIPPTNYILQ